MIRPLGNKVIVERIAAEKQTASGLIIKGSLEGPDKAKILAIGPDVTEVVVGEIALINWNKASKAEGETFVIPVEDIVFIYED